MTGIFSGSAWPWLVLVLVGIGLLIGFRLGWRSNHTDARHWWTADQVRLRWPQRAYAVWLDGPLNLLNLLLNLGLPTILLVSGANLALSPLWLPLALLPPAIWIGQILANLWSRCEREEVLILESGVLSGPHLFAWELFGYVSGTRGGYVRLHVRTAPHVMLVLLRPPDVATRAALRALLQEHGIEEPPLQTRRPMLTSCARLCVPVLPAIAFAVAAPLLPPISACMALGGGSVVIQRHLMRITHDMLGLQLPPGLQQSSAAVPPLQGEETRTSATS